MSISNTERDQILFLAGKQAIVPSATSTTPTPIAETMPRYAITTVTSIVTLSTGVLNMYAISLPQGILVSAISILAGTTAESSGTHAWLALFDLNRNLLGQGTDNTGAAAVGASALFTQSLQTAYTTTYSGLYYIGFNVTATTPNTLMGAISATAATNVAPILAGTSTTGLLGTAPSQAIALTAVVGIAYAFVS